MPPTDLERDVATPEDVVTVLNNIVNRYYETSNMLEASWQDKNAGRIWRKIADRLEKAADQIERLITKEQ